MSISRLRRVRPKLEVLEARCVLDVRSITGVGNNLANPDWGAAGTDLIRIAPAAYADGQTPISTFAGPALPGTRQISNVLSDQTDPADPAQDLSVTNQKLLSDFIYVFGQFLDHDLDLTKDNSGQAFNIPPGSPTDPMGTEPFTRSQFDPATGTSAGNPRQQVQSSTSFLDGSQVYGSSAVVADALRTHVGGRLKTSPGNLLPFYNTTYFTPAQLAALDMANDAHQVPDDQLFAAGDRRANENIQLISMQTLFLREHNRLADLIHAAHPALSDEQIYQEARRLVGAELEIITYTEWLPALLGSNALPAYAGYNPDVNPGIANEFSTSLFRFAHSQLDNDVERVKNNGTEAADGSVDLAQSFFNPTLINLNGVVDPKTGHTATGIGPILKGAASADAQEVDLLAVRDIRNFLFVTPQGTFGTDLIARDIQRGRDHGLTDYNSLRAAYGLPRVTSFAQITSNVHIQQQLRLLYGNVDNIDSFVGALAEDHVPGADVGPLTRAVLVNQFARLRDGDRFFYLNETFTAEERYLLQRSGTLAKVIELNTGITNLQANVFFFKPTIEGTVYFDRNGDGTRNVGDQGLAGIVLQLKDDAGNVVATATTDAHGHYRFDAFHGLSGTGNYTVSVAVPSGFKATTPVSREVHVTGGDLDIDGLDFGLKLA